MIFGKFGCNLSTLFVTVPAFTFMPYVSDPRAGVVVDLRVAQCAGDGSQFQVRYPSDILHEPLIGHSPAYGERREIPPLMVCGEPGRSIGSEIGGNHLPRIKHVGRRPE